MPIAIVILDITDPKSALDINGNVWNLDAGNPGDLRVANGTYNLRFGVATSGGGADISRIFSFFIPHYSTLPFPHRTILLILAP